MADLGEAQEVANMDLGNDLLPDGRYIAQVIEEVEKDTANGKMVTFTWEVLDGPCEGRRFWERYNYLNSNADAQRIARRELGRFAKAAGVDIYSNTEDLHMRPIHVDVIVRKGNNGYADSNGVKSGGYHEIGAEPASAPPAAQENRPSTARSTQNGGSAATQNPAPRAAAGGGRPWERK